MPLGYGAAAAPDASPEEEEARLSKALRQKSIGPFILGKQHGENTFEVDLPSHLRTHNTFNVGLFKPSNIDDERAQQPPPPIRVLKTGEAEYEVERILGWQRNSPNIGNKSDAKYA